MATKPSTVPTWATDANFGSGPANGHPTKVTPPGAPSVVQGSVPGEGAAAEFLNWLHNLLCTWVGWVDSGSSAGAADAHVVETSATGATAVRLIQAIDGAGGYVEMSGATGMTYRQGTLPDAPSNVEVTTADTWLCTDPTANRVHYLLEGSAATPPRNGQRTTVGRGGTAGFQITIAREGGNALALLPASTHCSVTVEWRGGRWVVLQLGVGATIGADPGP